MDYDVLKALSSREAYERYARFVKHSSLSKESYSIFSAMGEWFKNNPTQNEIPWPSFQAWYVLVRHVKMDKVELDIHKQLISALATREPTDDLQPLMEGLAKRDYASQIAEVALRMADGDYSKTFDDIESLLEEYNKRAANLSGYERDLGSFSVASLQSVSKPGLQWRLWGLQQSCGDLRQGDLCIFAKRPDSGGTTFLASESTYMAEQMPDDRSVLWINNEEQGDKVRRRVVQAELGWTNAEIDANPAAALQEYAARMGGMNKVHVFDRAKVHIKDVEALCKTIRPGLIIFDQLHKVKGFDAEAEHDRQTQLFNWSRELAKEWAPVIAVHQLGGDAENMKWVGMDKLFGAKTGPQGEADLIITMGRTIDGGNSRYIYIPKNKLLTPVNPERRNGRWEVQIDTERARFNEPYRPKE